MTYKAIVPQPCKDCPFRKDVPGFLTQSRAEEIAHGIGFLGESFTCHKSNSFDDETGEVVVTERSRHCAGAALILEKEEKPNQVMQVAERLGHYNQPVGAELVFDSLAEFVDHHGYWRNGK